MNQPNLLSPELNLLRHRRTKIAQSQHDHVVEQIALHYLHKGLYVRAHLKEWIHGRPDFVGTFIPDVAVYDNTGITNIEVETIDSFPLPHSFSQFNALDKVGKSVVYLAVPGNTDRYQVDKLVQKFNARRYQNLELIPYKI